MVEVLKTQKKIFSLSGMCFLLVIYTGSYAQKMHTYISATTGSERLADFENYKRMKDSSIFKTVGFENIGPFQTGGRVNDIDANPEIPSYFYIATPSGGVWRTENNGQSYIPIFDSAATLSIGDIAINWKNNETIWVGTGDANSSRSSYSGTGIYRSTDKGVSWQHKGLENTSQIARIVLHPTNENVLWVAVMGSLYSENEERGVYKTIDAGKTWKKVLYIDNTTGAIDLVINPQNPDILYVAMWHRQTRAWWRIKAGETSGIYKTRDGGNTWKLISDKKSQFPQGSGIGRIGLAIFDKNPDILYAFVDNQTVVKKETSNFDKTNALNLVDLKTLKKEEFLALTDNKIDVFLKKNNYSSAISSIELKKMIENGNFGIANIYYHKIDSNLIDEKPIEGIQIYKSTNAGEKWKLMNTNMPDDYAFKYNFGYYFGQISISAEDENELYIGGIYLYKSKNGGASLTPIRDRNMHVDVHAIWLNPKDSEHIIVGNDGGVNISYNGGKSWTLANAMPITQFYAVNHDNLDNYTIYGGTQDNGTLYSSQKNNKANYKSLSEGDGMQVQIDTANYQYIISGYQYGEYFKTQINKNSQMYSFSKSFEVKPNIPITESKLRFGWQTPILLSPLEENILFIGANKLLKINLQTGETEIKSPDLTNGGEKGCTPFGSIFTFSISPLDNNLIYTGSDDGVVFKTENAGMNWDKISTNLPQKLKITKIIASKFNKNEVYLSINGYSFDNFESFVFFSDDKGESWKKIGMNLPKSPVNTLYEDPFNENILFAGTDIGLFISLDKGKNFYTLHKNLPAVPISDIKINQKAKHLIVSTFGRSIFIADMKEIYKVVENQCKK